MLPGRPGSSLRDLCENMDISKVQSIIRSIFQSIISGKRSNMVIVAGVISFFYIFVQLFVPISIEQEIKEVEIPAGTSYRNAFTILQENGLVRNKYFLIILGRITGLDRKIKAGYYSFRDRQMPISVLKTLLDGDVVEYTVTIIEGENMWDVARKLSGEGIMTEEDFFGRYKNRSFLDSLNIQAPSIEGYLFPDTYMFPKGIAPEEVLKVMVDTMRVHFTNEMYQRMAKLGFNERQVLTLASIIEKEAVVDFERPVISAVYHNRLEKRMRLQADPTVIYGVKDSRLGVTRNDLRRKTPYNTYMRSGLPPGPIGAPGLRSIMAALYPADVPYLYFVSKDNREHFFSESIRDHFNAVNRFRKKRAEGSKER